MAAHERDPQQQHSILDFVKGLFVDKAARQEFREHPQEALAQAGLSGLTAAEVRAATPDVIDRLPPELAERVGPVMDRLAAASGRQAGEEASQAEDSNDALDELSTIVGSVAAVEAGVVLGTTLRPASIGVAGGVAAGWALDQLGVDDAAQAVVSDAGNFLLDAPVMETAGEAAEMASWAVEEFEEGNLATGASAALGAAAGIASAGAGIPIGGVEELFDGDPLQGAGEVAGSVLGTAAGGFLGGVAGGYAGGAAGWALDEIGVDDAASAAGQAVGDAADAASGVISRGAAFLGCRP